MKKMLVVSAHPGDVLWRCAGTVAKHVVDGGEVRILSLSYGIAGESAGLWAKPDMSWEKARVIRNEQFEKVRIALGAQEAEIWDMAEYPFRASREDMYRLAKVMRLYQPDTILTHHNSDPLNPDHGSILSFVMDSMEIANADGIDIEGTKPGFPRATIYCFEPHAPEASHFNPNVFVDITGVWDIKDSAMQCMEDKASIRKIYIDRAKLRAVNAKSFGRKGCEYAEAYYAVFPFAKSGNLPQ